MSQCQILTLGPAFTQMALQTPESSRVCHNQQNNKPSTDVPDTSAIILGRKVPPAEV